MKFRIHKNGWTVFCEDIDLAQVTQEEVDQIAEQWLAIHRRLAFKDMSKRLLWRLTTDFSNSLGKNYTII
jgi:hypothetical protein